MIMLIILQLLLNKKKNSNDLFQTVPNNKYKGLFEDFMF